MDAYCANAVTWAADNGISKGTGSGIGSGLFDSANDCTSAQITAFPWRLYMEKGD
ncbi:hypothetical protein GPK87_01090 [Oscillibacter sp. MCC667]|nr:hypothetical protein [Oscillibacter sp. MCC667]